MDFFFLNKNYPSSIEINLLRSNSIQSLGKVGLKMLSLFAQSFFLEIKIRVGSLVLISKVLTASEGNWNTYMKDTFLNLWFVFTQITSESFVIVDFPQCLAIFVLYILEELW